MIFKYDIFFHAGHLVLYVKDILFYILFLQERRCGPAWIFARDCEWTGYYYIFRIEKESEC